MRLRVLDTGLRPARWNVAMSAALLESVDAGAPATLRFHRYPVSCVIGRNQDVGIELDLAGCRSAGVEIARRMTGGGAVVMGPGVLAFDLVLPGTRPSALDLGRRAGIAVCEALTGLGYRAVLATPGSIEIDGWKVSGSAGRLGRRAALHQATLILDLGQAAPLSLLRRRTEGGRPTADPGHRVTGLSNEADAQCVLRDGALRLLSMTQPVDSTHERHAEERARARVSKHAQHLGTHLAAGFGAAFGLPIAAEKPTAAELARAEAILARTVGREDFVFEGDVDERRVA